MNPLAEANCRFAVDLIKEQMKDFAGKNYMGFPVGAEVTLGLLWLGSGGKTANEISKVLHELTGAEPVTATDYPLSESACDKPGGFHSRFKQFLSAINQHSKYHKLKIHSRLYGLTNYGIMERYIECIKEVYNSELERVDFTNATEEVRQKMNSWVERQTNGEIKNFFPANSIDRSTILVLLNTVYFKGSWKIPFNPKDTYKGVFWTCQDQSIYVDMMIQKGTFNIANLSNPPMLVLEIPYYNDEMSMLIFMPGHNFSPDEILSNSTYEKFLEWTRPESMRSVETKISIPKFTVRTEYSLKRPFSGLGVKDLFTPGKANLSNITGNTQFVVSDIRQAVVFSVSEEGTEGAGAARTEVVSGSHPEIKIDKPFFFVVKMKGTGCMFFFGKICTPQ